VRKPPRFRDAWRASYPRGVDGYLVEAYYLSNEAIASVVGSRDRALHERVLADSSGLIKTHAARYDDKPLTVAIDEVFRGEMGDFFEFGYNTTLALWPIIAALASKRPAAPSIARPFVPLDDVAVELDDAKLYPRLSTLFWSLMAYDENAYALKIESYPSLADRPSIITLPPKVLAKLAPESKAMRAELDQLSGPGGGAAWIAACGGRAPDLLRLLDWLDAAHAEKLDLCLVLDGDS